jgi:cell division protein FtsW
MSLSLARAGMPKVLNNELSPPLAPHIDNVMLLVSVMLVLTGLIMIASASVDIADARNGNPFHYVIRHGIFIVLGCIAGAFTYQLPSSWWEKTGWLALSFSLLMLLVVLLPGIGKEVNGSTRWISFGGLNFQPSELAKLLLVSYLAGYLVRRLDEVRTTWWGFAKPMLVLGLVALLLLSEPDLGSTVVIGSAFLGMIFLSGARLGQFIILIAGCLASVALLIYSQPYRLKRLVGYTDPWADPYGSGYQVIQSLIAFGRGDWSGVGLGNSIQKQFYLPEAHTDFVFAIMAEEFGLIGTLVVVSLFAVLIYRALRIGYLAEKKNQLFKAYFAYGIGILFAVQSFINIGVNMGLLPTKGLTLPLVSYGGSSLIVSCMCIGVLMRIHRDISTLEDSDSETNRNTKGKEIADAR